ncbi:MAG TPA: pyridoxamine 5'-phosphate oxidase family protein [Streptosporangiaceae bacterium]|nr:pyridoxamine 5'-phosphate oxidase family protein [Streptosporangiaceae bacterium]
MTEAEVAEMLAAHNKVQLATNGPDGFPHLVTMYYVMMDGLITFWTYQRSQKALNLGRDPRISCLVEIGSQYFDLKGVLVQGTVRRIEDPSEILEIGRGITATFSDPAAMADDAVTDYVQHAARKRFGYAVEPSRIISWDHTKLLG